MSTRIPGTEPQPAIQHQNADSILPKLNSNGQVLHPYSGKPMSHDEFKKYMHKLQVQAENDEELRKVLLGLDEETLREIELAFLEQLQQPRESQEDSARRKTLKPSISENIINKGV